MSWRASRPCYTENLAGSQDLQRRFGNATLRQTVEDGEERPDPFKAFNDGLQQIHPMTVMNSQLKVTWAKQPFSMGILKFDL